MSQPEPFDTGYVIDASAEGRHVADGQGWAESWVVEALAPDSRIGVRMELRLHPTDSRSQFSVLLVRPDEPIVWIDESDAPLPPVGLELRASGLWMEFIAQTAGEHFTADIEAFALELDHPSDAVGRGYGTRVPVACELEWQTVGEPEAVPGGYRIPARVIGDFQLSHHEYDLAGWGWRSHTWGRAVSVDPVRPVTASGPLRAGAARSADEPLDLGLLIGWGYGLNGEHHRLVETATSYEWRSFPAGAAAPD